MIRAIYETALIFWRELNARKGFLLAGLVCSLLVLVLPFVPGLSHLNPGDIRSAASFGIALAAGIVLAIGFGATLFGRDLSEQRAGFYFELPVLAASVWIGRFAAACFVVFACETLILAAGYPWFGASPLMDLSVKEILGVIHLSNTSGPLFIFVAIPPFLLLISHCISIMVRARTAWLIADLLGFTLVPVAGWIISSPFFEAGYKQASQLVIYLMVISVAVALLAATSTSVSRGRTDLSRAHRVLSATLWGILIASTAMIGLYSNWLLNVTPSDLDEYHVHRVLPGGRWIQVSGASSGHLDVIPVFLVGTDGQRWFQLKNATPRRYYEKTTSSSDGHHVLWLGRGDWTSPRDLWYADLSQPDPQSVSTTIRAKGFSQIDLSPDSKTVSIMEHHVLSVYELSSGDLITTVGVPHGNQYSLVGFQDPNTIRIVSSNRSESDWTDAPRFFGVYDLQVSKGAKPVELYRSPWPDEYQFDFDPHLRYFIPGLKRSLLDQSDPRIRYIDRSELKIFDAGTQTYLSNIKPTFKGFLVDGRAWSNFEDVNGNLWVSIQEPESGSAEEFNLETGRRHRSALELAGGGILVATEENPPRPNWDWNWDRLEVFDPDTGTRRLVGEHLSILRTRGPVSSFLLGEFFAYSNSSGRIGVFRDSQDSIYAWDPDGEQLVRLHDTGG